MRSLSVFIFSVVAASQASAAIMTIDFAGYASSTYRCDSVCQSDLGISWDKNDGIITGQIILDTSKAGLPIVDADSNSSVEGAYASIGPWMSMSLTTNTQQSLSFVNGKYDSLSVDVRSQSYHDIYQIDSSGGSLLTPSGQRSSELRFGIDGSGNLISSKDLLQLFNFVDNVSEDGYLYLDVANGDSDYRLYMDLTYASAAVDGVSQVPVPAAGWLMGSGLIGLSSLARRKK